MVEHNYVYCGQKLKKSIMNSIDLKIEEEKNNLDVNGTHYDDAVFNADQALCEGDTDDKRKVLKYLQTVNKITILENSLTPVFG